VISHQLGRHEAQWREGLEILVEPGPPAAVPQIELTFARPKKIVILGMDDADVELVGVLGGAPQGMLGDQRPHELLVIGVDEYRRPYGFHGSILSMVH